MNTSIYYRERAKRWAEEVSGVGRRKSLFTQIIDRIARRDGVRAETVKEWVRRAEREAK